MKAIQLILLALCLSMVSGCAKTLGVYDTSYGCPQMENGECLPVDEALESAIQEGYGGSKGKDTIVTDFRLDPVEEEEFLLKEVGDFKALMLAYEKCVRAKGTIKCQEEKNRLLEHYRTAEARGRAKELHGMSMQERVTKLAVMEAVVSGGSNTVPIRQPDTIMELHILPYKTDFGALASERVIWVVVQEGEWTWATAHGENSRPKLGATH